jgi:glutamate-1-semialdehyde 2,1-aminomutase
VSDAWSTARSADLYERACQTLATGVSSALRRHVTPVPLYVERAAGAYFYDADGHELLDYTLGWGPLILGGHHPAVDDAVSRQLERGYTFGAQHEGEIRLSRALVEILPGVEQVIFSNTGTEAVQVAIRIARAATGRNRIVKFEGHYHGWAANVLVSYHPRAGDPCRVQPACGGMSAAEYADTLVLPWNDLAALRRLLHDRGDEIACVLTEPMLANSGSCMPAPGFLQGLVESCREHGAVSIFDEVITGFRLALGGAREYFGVEPDLSVYGKAMAAGLPLSAVAGRARMFDVLRDGRTIHAGTYNGNPVSVAAAEATIEVLRGPGVFDRMHAHGGALRNTIERSAARHGRPVVTSGAGTIFSVHVGVGGPPGSYQDTLAADTDAYARFRERMLRHAVQLLPDGRWYVGAAHGSGELDKAVEAIEHSAAGLVA